jgi:hypothetical protein
MLRDPELCGFFQGRIPSELIAEKSRLLLGESALAVSEPPDTRRPQR